MPDTKYWFAASTEEFTPTEMLEQGQAADAAGFDEISSRAGHRSRAGRRPRRS